MTHEGHPRYEIDREAIAAYAATFIPRFDCYPLQKKDGSSYVAVHEPMTLDMVASHFYGKRTIGAYALDTQNQAKWVCLDADDETDWQGLTSLARNLSHHTIPSYLEPSRRGGHLWLFFESPIPGTATRRFGKQLLKEHHLDTVELYPKQDELRTGTGSLVRLPLGFHQKETPPHRYHFITLEGNPLASTIREQIAVLAQPERVPQSFVDDVLTRAPESKAVFPTRPFKPSKKNRIVGDTPSERIKNRVSVADFVSQYVDLDRNGRGYCPFHDDHHMSFGVNTERNFWNCFAECGEPRGGSVIDFWMRWRQINGQSPDFKDTIIELIELLNL